MEKKLIHRDISWVSFNERVLQEAENQTNTLYERLKFLAIFFEVWNGSAANSLVLSPWNKPLIVDFLQLTSFFAISNFTILSLRILYWAEQVDLFSLNQASQPSLKN